MFYGILNKKNLDKVMSIETGMSTLLYPGHAIQHQGPGHNLSGLFFPVQAIDILFHESFGYSLHQNVLPFAEQ